MNATEPIPDPMGQIGVGFWRLEFPDPLGGAEPMAIYAEVFAAPERHPQDCREPSYVVFCRRKFSLKPRYIRLDGLISATRIEGLCDRRARALPGGAR